ncbi:MAG TPA: hypothetical protein VHT24_17155 [Pseudacidobacterium sp.]|jgi:hypothetical protein|nr:hypothetical protein [Pseudacidobacterium sp.]
MAATTTANHTLRYAGSRRASIPWYLWCAALAVTSVTIGAHWDVSWHRSIGRDTFWTPAHMAIYACGILAAICCGYLILNTTFRRQPEFVASSVSVFGFRAPLGAFLAAWGGVAMLTSAPFDNWWHNAYGLDVKIISPPHTLLMMGIFAVDIGAFFLIAAAMNRAENVLFKKLQWLLLYLGGLMMVLTMFFRMEYTWDIKLHSSGAYIAVAIGVPTYLTMFWWCSRNRWAATTITAFYTIFLIGLVLILPLFPAEPKLGPVYQPVHQFIPPLFPLLLVVPAFFMDLLLQRTQSWKPWFIAIVAGPLFVLSFVAVQWPFASFLMTDAAKNRFFGAGYLDYGTPSWSHAAMRQFFEPEHGLILWKGLALAMLYASLSTLIGIALGKWMRKVQR